MSRTEIIEKVKFWEEQDKINEALIPRVLEMHNTLKTLSKNHVDNNESLIDIQIKIKKIGSAQNLHETRFGDFKYSIDELSKAHKSTTQDIIELSNSIKTKFQEFHRIIESLGSQNVSSSNVKETSPGNTNITSNDSGKNNNYALVIAGLAFVISIISLVV